MKRARLVGWKKTFLTRARVIRFATTNGDGTVHVVPVCPVMDGGVIYIGSDKSGRKMTNIRRRPRVGLVADHYVDSWKGLRGVAVAGRADVFTTGAVFERARRLLYRKYPQYERVAALDPSDSVIIRVTPSEVMSWRY